MSTGPVPGQYCCCEKLFSLQGLKESSLSAGRLTSSMSSLLLSTPLFPVLKMLPVALPVSGPLPFTGPQEVVLSGQGRSLHAHLSSVSVPAGSHLQPHRAQALQSRPVVPWTRQRLHGPAGEQPGSGLGPAGPRVPVASSVPAGMVQRVLEGGGAGR